MVNQGRKIRIGERRKPYRIREFLHSKGLKQLDITRETGVDPATVSRTVNGMENNRKVLKFLLKIECPTQHLDLPQDLKNQEQD